MLIWLAYFLLPNDAGGLVHGLPLGPIEAAALLALAWLWMTGRRLRGAVIAGGLLAATTIAGAAIPGEGGFRARYFASAAASGPHERSTEFAGDAFTRIDRRLDFDPATREFPLPFFNDNSRFNFYKMGEPDRRYLGFSVRWSGMWLVGSAAPRVYLDAPKADAQLYVDGAEVLAVGSGGGSPAVIDLALAPGWHRVDITFASAFAGGRAFSSGVMDGDRRVPFDGATIVTQQIRTWQMTAMHVLRWIKIVVDLAVLAWLAWSVAVELAHLVREVRQPATPVARLAQVGVLFAAAAAVDAMVYAWRWWQHNMVLLGGDDTMTYEGYARDILLNGILMNGGLPPGQGEPFYYQAFYPYFLAFAHLVFGEGMFGPILLQRLLVAAAAWAIVVIAVRFTDAGAWKVALPIAVLFLWWKFSTIAGQPLNESLYVPLLVMSVAALIRTCLEPATRHAWMTGLLGGLATITRSTVLLSWALVWPAAWIAMKAAPRRHAIIATIASVTIAIFSLIAMRNWIVAAVFAPTSTELGITLLGGNEVPPGVTIDLSRRAPIYQRFKINDHTATVIEYALTAPGLFAQNLGRKALFALGFYEPYAPGWGYSPVYIAVWTSAIAGLALALRQSPSPIAVSLPLLVAVTQLVAVVIVYPKGERLIVPIHTLLVPYAAVAAWTLVRRRTA